MKLREILEAKIGNTEVLENPSKQDILDYSKENSVDEFRYIAAIDGNKKHFYVWPTHATKVLHYTVINKYGLEGLKILKGIFTVKLGILYSKIYVFEKKYDSIKKGKWNWTGITFK